MFQKHSTLIPFIIVLTLLIPYGAQAQFWKKTTSKTNKKELLKQVEQLSKEVDSLKSIIEGGAIEMSDTTTQFEGDSLAAVLDIANSGIFEDAEPGSNPDSLINIWYTERNIPMERYIIESDTTEFYSNIPDSIYIAKIKRMNSFIPIPYNHIVRNQIIAYTEKMPTHSKKVLGLSQYYLPIIEEILDYYGLPKELKAMAIIESGLNPIAVSRMRAKGLWQFMPRTAMQYNLQLTSYVDERLDPIKATHAAAKYLHDSYTIFGDWALAISSYNCGVGNVNKAIRRAGGSKKFWDIYPYLPRETRGYVPAFVGALYMLTYYKDYPNLIPDKITLPPHVDTFAIKKNLHFEQISANIEIPVETLRALNPQYTQDIIPGDSKEFILRLPYTYSSAFIDKEELIYTYKDSVYFTPLVYNNLQEDKMMSQSKTFYHRVRPGETLGHIALKYRVSVNNLMRWNGLTKKSILRINQRLVIYGYGGSASSGKSASASKSGSSSKPATTTSGGYTYYTVKKGDTLGGIAYKFPGVTLNDLLRLNGLNKNSKIYPGKKLKIKKN